MRLARRTLEAELGTRPAPWADPEEPPARLSRPGRAFVTLRRGAALRGCIGHVGAALPLGEVVRRMALLAATEDPRFPPVRGDELGELQIEISVLSEPVRLETVDPAFIEPGRDGVVVRRGHRQGLLLPQVATEQGWDAEGLLAAVCRKAGLPDDAWRRRGSEVYVFQADVFGE